MELFDKIIEKRERGKYNFVHFYPVVIKNENGCETKKFDQVALNKTREKLKKMIKNKVITWQQIEFHYKNLFKIEKTFQNGTNEINYMLRSNNDFMLETYNNSNNLVVLTNVENINESQFPPLSNYDKIIKKNFEKYNIENIDILFVSQNNETMLCVDMSNTQNNDKIKFKNLLENIM
jgi:hypothetical protein